MRLFYTHTDCPFTEQQLSEIFHGLNDGLTSIKKTTVPYFDTDPSVLLRYDDYDVYDAMSIMHWLERMDDALSLGVILILDKELILTLDTSFTATPEVIDDYKIRGLGSPFLSVIMSTTGLTNTQAFKVLKHEMGHFYALDHCDEPNCLMNDYSYNELDKLDSMNNEICIKCKTKLTTIMEV